MRRKFGAAKEFKYYLSKYGKVVCPLLSANDDPACPCGEFGQYLK